MQVVETKFGRFLKDGKRYRIRPSNGQTQQERTADALAAGYVVDVIGAHRLEKKTEIADARYETEFGGFTDPTAGMFVRTDERTRTLLTAAAVRAVSDPSYEVANWKTSDGSFITLTNAMILALDQAVRDFIASQFAKEAELTAQIDNAATPEEVKSITW